MFSGTRRNAELLLIGILTLFLEMLLIRWISTEVRIFAYLGNLVLLACFLGLGVGCRLAGTKANTFITLGMLLLITVSVKSFPFFHITDMLSGFSESAVWFEARPGGLMLVAQGMLLTLYMFIMILFLFVPLGQRLGSLLDADADVVLAYSLNVAGSLLGIWVFSVLSSLYTRPWLWFFLALVLLAYFLPRSRASFSVGALASGLILVVASVSDPGGLALWSPYQKLEAFPTTRKGVPNGQIVTVNNASYMSMTDLSREFLDKHPGLYDMEAVSFNQYEIPFKCAPSPRSVLIVGAGGGNDVAGALRNNVQSVDAVEIDPGIYRLGSMLHPEKPYRDTRVRVFVDDARSFFKKTKKRYDVIVFGLLDSHTLSSHYNNLRLDQYVYTKESLAEARELLSDDGILVVSFAVQKPWIGTRLLRLLQAVFGDVPLVFHTKLPTDGGPWGGVMYITGRNPAQIARYVASQPDLSGYIGRNAVGFEGSVRLATDDWPYLYLEGPAIPKVHLIIVGALGVLFVAASRFLVSTGGGSMNPHFFLLGSAFMLLEFQNVSRPALLFGSTWSANAYIVSAILALVLLANVCARYSFVRRVHALYGALLAAVLVLYLVPLDVFNGFGYPARSFLASIFMNIPIFFASLIFIVSLQDAPTKQGALGSNLMGAALGGLLEPASFVIGIKALLVLVLLLYVGSWLSLVIRARGRRPNASLDATEATPARSHSNSAISS